MEDILSHYLGIIFIITYTCFNTSMVYFLYDIISNKTMKKLLNHIRLDIYVHLTDEAPCYCGKMCRNEVCISLKIDQQSFYATVIS